MLTERAELKAEDYKNLMLNSLADCSDDLTSLKKQAFENFTQLGFPTRKMENWKYINLNKFLSSEFNSHLDIPEISANQHCLNKNLLNKLQLHPFANLCIAAVNTNNIEKITICDNSKKPIELNFNSCDSFSTQKIIEIEIAENINTELVFNFLSSDKTCCAANYLFFIKLNNNAKLNIYSQQNINKSSYLFNAIFADLNKSSELNYFSLDQGGKLARTDLEIDFNAEGASCNLNGLILAEQDQVIDHHNIIRHNIGHCDSSENFKTVLKDKSKAIFNGKIIMSKNAQKSSTKQSNKNLLLSPKAEIYTKPELEIYVDDVKAAHGATTGQLDRDALYYLKTRGFTDFDAKKILLNGFIDEIILNISNENIRQQWKGLLNNE